MSLVAVTYKDCPHCFGEGFEITEANDHRRIDCPSCDGYGKIKASEHEITIPPYVGPFTEYMRVVPIFKNLGYLSEKMDD